MHEEVCRAIVAIFSASYLKLPTVEDVNRLLNIGQQRGFSGMLGSLDCMHWKWKICPTAWAGQFQVEAERQRLFLKQLLITIYGYDMPILVCWEATTTSTYLNDLVYSQILLKALLLQLITSFKVKSIIWDII